MPRRVRKLDQTADQHVRVRGRSGYRPPLPWESLIVPVTSSGRSPTSPSGESFRSTNLVIELGIIMALLLGWQFTLAEFVGGPIMIVLVAMGFRLVLRQRLLGEARRQSDRGLAGQMEGHAAMDMSTTEGGSLWRRLRSANGRTSVSLRRTSRPMGDAEVQAASRTPQSRMALVGRSTAATADALRPLAPPRITDTPNCGSRMTGDCHVRFCESGRGRFPPATHQGSTMSPSRPSADMVAVLLPWSA